MLTIGVLNAKGGVGKTTIAAALSVRALKDFGRVAVVDLDPQRGAARWWTHRGHGDHPCVMSGETVASDAIEALHMTGWDIAFFDGPPGSLEMTENAIQAVDFVVIPMRAGDQDLGSTEFVVAACVEQKRPYLIVLNDTQPRADRLADETAQVLTSSRQPLAGVRIARRNAHTIAMGIGKAASEISRGRDDKAVDEIEALYTEVLALARKAAKRRAA